MQKRLDSIDIKILEALGVYGPRSISKVARNIDMPTSTVRDRIKILKSHFSLLLQAKVYHTFIGLKKAFVFARAAPGHERLLWECMRANDYWFYLTARYDVAESFYGIYGIPINHIHEFEQFVKQMKELGVALSIDLSWSTCIQEVSFTDEWYNHGLQAWSFKWDKWIDEIENQGTSLPATLVEPKSYPQKADKIDIIILKELYKDAECKLSDIANLLRISSQRVQYHFENHVISKGLIEGYTVFLPHFEDASETYCFRFHFCSKDSMAKFALSFQGKPFVRSIGKIIGENALFVHIYLPRKEFRGFTDSLSKLIKTDAIEHYDYAIEDLSRKQAETIPYQLFKKKSWIYDHEVHLRKLHEITGKSSIQRKEG